MMGSTIVGIRARRSSFVMVMAAEDLAWAAERGLTVDQLEIFRG
jgi:hypothetical protein